MSEHICSVPVVDRTYAVNLVSGRIIINGREHLSFTDHDDARIDISDTVPPEDRPAVVAVAVAWAWRSATRDFHLYPVFDVNRTDENHP